MRRAVFVDRDGVLNAAVVESGRPHPPASAVDLKFLPGVRDRLVRPKGAGHDDLLACYHDDRDGCDCRKPRPGLLLEAAARLGIDLGRSYMIGDRWKDIACGAAAGCATVFVDYRYAEPYQGPAPSYISVTAAGALDYILSKERECE
jgi:D-glycero-D-manno-heptose 1,7-bisphosphate phosphatase